MDNMRDNKLGLILFICFLFFSCSKKNNQTIIRGNIPNLPDGTMYMFEGNSTNRIDSTKTTNGKFTLVHKWSGSEPVYIGIDHVDNKGILRLFSFTTNAKYKGIKGWGTNIFLSDPTITINGNLTYDEYTGIQLPPDKKPVTGPPLKSGKQTEAFYNIDGDLFEKIDNKAIQTIKEKIVQYPNSYHLLYGINSNKNSFSASQVKDLLNLFKGEITQNETYKKLYSYNEKRFNVKKLTMPELEDNTGVKRQIIDKKYKKHLIIFWASWCAPCRQEIPMLKSLSSLYNDNVEFISISIDTDKSSWQKALKEENMNWKQLITSNNSSEKEALQIHFKLNQAIPYTVLIDNNLKILSSSTGLSNENELSELIKK